MSINGSYLAALALGALIALGCGDSSDSKGTDAGSTNAGTSGGHGGSSGAGSDAGGGGGGGAGTDGEPSITCLGSSMCEADQVCCGTLATMSTGCETGSACPATQTQLCSDAADCGGAACMKFTIMGIELGVCGGAGDAGTDAAGTGEEDAGVN